MKKYGTRSEVFADEAEKTRGGLTKEDLMLSKDGKIVSKKKSLAALETYKKYGFKKREQPKEKVAEEPPKKKRRRRKKKTEE